MTTNNREQPMTCATCRAMMQEYLDETLPGPRATQLFLHVRGCAECHRELEAMKAVFGMLDAMPAIEAPDDFDARIMQSIPLEAYREMEPLRRPRMPVILEEESLPSFLRSTATRTVGLITAAVAVAGLAAGRLPDAGVAIAALGVLPEALVRLQQVGRRIYVGAAHKHEA